MLVEKVAAAKSFFTPARWLFSEPMELAAIVFEGTNRSMFLKQKKHF